MENYKVRDDREKELYQKIKDSQNEMVELTEMFKIEDQKYHKTIKHCNKNKKPDLKLQTENNFLKYIAFTSFKLFQLDE